MGIFTLSNLPRTLLFHLSILIYHLLCFTSTNATDILSTSPLPYTDNGYPLQGYLAIPHSASVSNPQPAVILFPDWDGVNAYEKLRATMISDDLGYVGFAADIFGVDLQENLSFQQRIALTTTYRSNATLFVSRMQAAVTTVGALDFVDETNIALGGYCFGGSGVLTYALSGLDDVKAIVSFHGGLTNLPFLGATVYPKVLVLSGGDDDTSTAVADLETALNEGNATWEISRFADVLHGFTKFDSYAYNERADLLSWDSMTTFLREAIGGGVYEEVPEPTACVTSVDYEDGGVALRGYLAKPASSKGKRSKSKRSKSKSKVPGFVIFPDWDGVNTYEKRRAEMLADLGYVAFAADIYGADLQENLDFQTRIAQSSMYRNNPPMFMSRMKAAIAQVKALPDVDPESIILVGYCFGGTGVLQYAIRGYNDVNTIVSYHGGLTGGLPNATVAVTSKILVLSGGDDDASSDLADLEMTLNDANATWQISRYSDVEHAWTVFGSSRYNLRADVRSWEAMHEFNAIDGLYPVEVQMKGLSDEDASVNGSPTVAPSLAPFVMDGLSSSGDEEDESVSHRVSVMSSCIVLSLTLSVFFGI